MFPFRIFLFFFTLSLFSQPRIEKTEVSSKEILSSIKQASQYLDEYKYELSLSKARIALHQAFESRNDLLVAKSYNVIAGNYEELYEFKKAILYYEKGLVYANKANNDTIKYKLYNNLGNVYCFEEKQFSKGLFYYQKSLKYSEREGDFAQIYMTKLNLTWAYFDANDFVKGKVYLDFINKKYKGFDNESYLVIINMLNGMYYSATKDFKKAESYFIKSINLAKNGNNKLDYSYALDEYTKFLYHTGNYKEAYENKALFHKTLDEIDTKVRLNKANVAGITLEIDEYKRKIDEIELKNNFQSQVLEKTKTISILLIISLLILLLLIYSLYRNFNLKKVKNLELVRTNHELVLAREKAEVASKLKSQFVSTITHELRTPLYGVIGITNMLVDEHKELSDSPHLKSLKFSAKYLLSLVNDVLQINKIEENRVVLEKMTFNIADEIEFIKNTMAYLAQKHNNTIDVKVDTAIPEYLIGDKLRLSQIIINLVSNALKFTHNGEIKIRVNLVDVKEKLYFIEFTIEDNGAGIAEENQEKIFDKFVQVSRKEIDYQGTGLGLSIVKQLLHLFNSTIYLKSELGKGTTFNFTIAFESDMAKTNSIINNINVDLSSSQIFNVLVVDDNKINLLITQKTIEKFNYKCSVALSGQEALALLEVEKFDTILMDINMPVMNGFETTKVIRERGIKTPTIALTAFDKEEITEEAISAGFNDIISKPFDSKQLYKIINEVIVKESHLK
ncbi:response regulator [Flavobacterium seoulense]|uniref:histidine kinase n=1 Tax=Flavobacterium seoulense TaxID=1492738 RepID=A0A066WVR1_9FLAO|nr:response regulator [Flavobacterium seoulense]KDN54745.1 histidine kinase [Flavobacterium seoulense]